MKIFIKLINAMANTYGLVSIGYFIAKGDHTAIYASVVLVLLTLAIGVYQNVLDEVVDKSKGKR